MPEGPPTMPRPPSPAPARSKTPAPVPSPPTTVADLLRSLGGIPASRVRLSPPPGTATEADVLSVLDRENRSCEIIDGVLVEKAMGYEEAVLTAELIRILGNFLKTNKLGLVAGPDGTLRLITGLLRIPDVSFVSWARLPSANAPQESVPLLTPDLAIEVLSRSNTPAEIRRKLREYFDAGTRLVWTIDRRKKKARAYTSPSRFVEIGEAGTLDGGDVLPGFTLPLRDLFAVLERGPDA